MKIKIELEITDAQLQNIDNVNTLMSFLANDLYTEAPEVYNYIFRLGVKWADENHAQDQGYRNSMHDCYR
mgnify:CR=1 FL=1